MASLESIFNHLVLPPRLPARQDINLEAIEESILSRLIRACGTIERLTGQQFSETWASLRHSLNVCFDMNSCHLEKASLLEAFSGLEENDLLILHIVEQNAGLLLRYTVNSNGAKSVTLEAFEASPSSKAVLAAESALLWDFPGRAVEVPVDEFVEASDSLATFLEQANREASANLVARVSKANASVVEIRDTTDPALITQMLLSLFEAVGSSVDVEKFRKRVRDDVSIHDAEYPWRRVPFWLVLRVATQRHLCLSRGDETGRACYKFLICTMIAQLLEECVDKLAPELTLILRAKLCRRLAKLETEKTQCKTISAVYESLFHSLGPTFESIIISATQNVESVWANFKKEITKNIPPLPLRVEDSATQLSLPNSRKYLNGLLNMSRKKKAHHPFQLPADHDIMAQKNSVTNEVFKLVKLENKIEDEEKSTPKSQMACQARCEQLASTLGDYLTFVGTKFNTNPEQMSLILLNLFDLWISLDHFAIEACPLLSEYHPIFHPELLDPLQLPHLSQMRRLRHIQEYLRDRCSNCRFAKKTILSEPNEDCFAARIHQAAVVFELEMPGYLAAYRTATWRIFKELAHPSKPINTKPPVMLLKDYSQLNRYFTSHNQGVSMASVTKSFLRTHFKAYRILVNKSDVLLPLGLNFKYYDIESGIWLEDLNKPLTFQHICGIHIPRSLRDSILPKSEHPNASEIGPSSYEVVANETKCPSEVSIHEFASFQRLLSGNSRRWLTILTELGSSNVNFSSEDTMHVFTQLATQAGPAGKVDIFGDVHVVFRDQYFCQRLAEQLDHRLRNIESNWRETHCMEMLITLSLRLSALSSGLGHQLAQDLLLSARKATFQWFVRLRDEVRSAIGAEAADRAAIYGLGAALLCRRTFTPFQDNVNATINAQDLQIFVQASVALQENLVINIEELPGYLQNMLIRDMKMACQIQSLVQGSIQSNPSVLGNAINETWSDPENCTGRIYSSWKFLSSPHWVESTITGTTKNVSTQNVRYNYVEGHLLLDGRPLGKLPRDIRDAEVVKELFQNQHLLTFPSSLKGMTYVMATRIWGHEIHFGIRQDSVVIQALTKGGRLEFVPRGVFMDNSSYDLPAALLDDCVHWLNLDSKQLEIRRKPFIWKTRLSDWRLDVVKRYARRNKVFLVDPCSHVCKILAGIFHPFDDPRRMTVYQPPINNLSVELRHLELSFVVDENGLLKCNELRAVIDPNQDAGTLYGLESKIVLRDVLNVERRSIITTLGQIHCQRNGMHVAVRAQNNNSYGKFEIDTVLGRLTCPPEQLLLYSKAAFHAFTSFPLPDPLTGMTGTEEALHLLQSGQYQPWTPIGQGGGSASAALNYIKSLSPDREYYPRDKRSLQTVTWDNNLTTTIQDDNYHALVSDIIEKSNKLQAFALHGQEGMDSQLFSSPLRSRGESRSMTYQRDTEPRIRRVKDMIYQSRDREATSIRATNVYQIVTTTRKRPFTFYKTTDLSKILTNYKMIGGFYEYQPNTNISNSLRILTNSEIGEQWGGIVNFFRSVGNSYEAVFRLALFSFSSSADMNLIRSMAAFGCLDELKALQVPIAPLFADFKLHSSPTHKLLEDLIKSTYPIFHPRHDQSERERLLAAEKHRDLCLADGDKLAKILLDQWPCFKPSPREFSSVLINFEQALEVLLPEWQRLYWNRELSNFVVDTQKILNRYKGKKYVSKQRVRDIKSHFYVSRAQRVVPLLSKDLVVKSGIPIFEKSSIHRLLPYQKRSSKDKNKHVYAATCSELEMILESFTKSSDVLRQQYGKDLINSLAIFKDVNFQPDLQRILPGQDIIRQGIGTARAILAKQFDKVCNSLCARDDRFKWLQLSNLWPAITPVTILEQLRSNSNHQLGKHVKENLVLYGVLVTALQRLLRINHAYLKADERKLLEEWRHLGHENWAPLNFPDWLLLEIDSNILIRSEQVEVAHAIISPASGRNSVLQMNMGKTSCILPMVAAVLANGKQLSRLIVPKALILQTAQTMQTRLGGLVGREICHIPFSRRTPTTLDMLKLYSELHSQALASCGIILTVPEHLLSFKLSGLQRLADCKLDEAYKMIESQNWLTEICRDVLDESDFTLAVKTQLIYPNGPQISVDGHPYRWKVVQILLSLVEDHLPQLQQQFPRSIEVVERPRGFPIVHLLNTDVEEALHHRISDDIYEGRASFLRLANSKSSPNKAEFQSILTNAKFDPDLTKRVSRLFLDESVVYKNLLLVRGLIVDGILLLCLKKRWGVHYGLHKERDPLAVPFEAKGVPSEQSEFGHPDVAIILTCLSFYYSGLDLTQFSNALHHVLSSDDPASEYDSWTSSCSILPDAFRHWNIINLGDRGQIEELWQHLRLNRNVLNHYMNKFVFPKHAKQFGVKLQASGWDLPLFTRSYLANLSLAKTTGFSGTKDNNMVLPLTISQQDLPSLLHTSAEVLNYLLQPRNRQCSIMAENGMRLSEEDLLQKIVSMKIRVLIDAGAYIDEMTNESLVKAWLAIDFGAKAAVYFGSDNRAWVQYRGKKSRVPLIATPFSENLSGCVIYFDQAHTRGTDLKLPQNSRAALTLSLSQTKDHTVQAAMRLRLLGVTQSVVFFAPPEVNQSIWDVCKNHGDEINSSHVIKWLLEQTCRNNENLQGLYIAQGLDFASRTGAGWKYAVNYKDSNNRNNYLKVIQHPERQTLEDLYGKRVGTQPISQNNSEFVELNDMMSELNNRRQAAKVNGKTIHISALEEVEQEREVLQEVEEQRYVAKPEHRSAHTFPGLHRTLSHFSRSGELHSKLGYEHVFQALLHTEIGQKHGIRLTKSRLFASDEFMRTVKPTGIGSNDDFLRPVEWILYSPSNETAMIVISEEVEIVIPIILAQKRPKVHVIVYAAPTTKNMQHFNDLSYFMFPQLQDHKIPSWLSLELGIFSGRLYFDFSEYPSLIAFLQPAKNPQGEVQNNEIEGSCFAVDPIAFLAEWLSLRRKGQDITNTPMGYICQKRILNPNHSFFATRNIEAENMAALSINVRGAEQIGSDDEKDDEEDSDIDEE